MDPSALTAQIEPADSEVTSDLPAPMALFWVGLAGATVLIVVLVWLKERFAGRTREARHAAHRAGFRYHGEDAKGIGATRFSVFGDFDRMSLSHQMSGRTPRGTPVVAFDFCAQFRYLVSVDEQGNRTRRRSRPGRAAKPDGLLVAGPVAGSVEWVSEGSVRSGAVVTVDAWMPSLVVAPEGLAWKAFSRLTGVDLDTESERFNRAYRVMSRDRRFADLFVSATVIDALLHTDGSLGVETLGDRLLVFGNLQPPRQLPQIALVAGMLAEQLPQLVAHEYPRAPARETPGTGIHIPGVDPS